MSLADEIYRREMDITYIERDMRGINPALSLYKILADKKRQLVAELKQMQEKRPPITLLEAPKKTKARLSASKKLYATKL